MRYFAAAIALAAANPAFAQNAQIYAFGDSFSDSGAGYVDGNGPSAVVYMARDLSVPFTYAGASDAAGRGLNFAVSGAGTGFSDGRVQQDNGRKVRLGRGMLTQVDDFASMVERGERKVDAAHTLFFLAGGLNDRAIPTEQTVANIEAMVTRLYRLGARNIASAILPEQIASFLPVAERLNPALRELPARLMSRFPGLRVVSSHWGSFFDTVRTEPARFGIDDITTRCAGRTLRGQDATPCAQPERHYFYHSNHPSTATHRHVGAMLAKEMCVAFPIVFSRKSGSTTGCGNADAAGTTTREKR